MTFNSNSDDESTPSQNSPLDQTIDSTTFGIPQHSQPRSAIKISSSVDTTNTNFLSAKESFDSLDDSSPFTVTSPQKSTIALFGTDVLSFLSPSKSNQEDTSITMPAKTVAKGSFAKKTPTESEEPHFDAATHIYEGVKNAWTWSRGLPVAGSVLGLYETAALTIVSKTTDGKDAASLDKEILHHITGLDKDVIDPAIAKLMAVIWPGVEKAEDILRCMPIVPLLFPMLKEDGEAEPEATPVKPNPFKVATSIDVN